MGFGGGQLYISIQFLQNYWTFYLYIFSKSTNPLGDAGHWGVIEIFFLMGELHTHRKFNPGMNLKAENIYFTIDAM